MNLMSDRPQSRLAASSVTATSPQQMRGLNQSAVLDIFWDATQGEGITATEIVATTGLTRATVLAICSDLSESGWLVEDRAPSATPGRGRQARRFTFNPERAAVAAADVGIRSVTCVIANLAGDVLGRAQYTFGAEEQWLVNRTDYLLRGFDEALESSGLTRSEVRSCSIGVAAPVTPSGDSYPNNEYWDSVRVDLPRLREYAPQWLTDIQNDADLAAIAELYAGGAELPSPSVTVLAGERLGAGIAIRGEVIRGANGGAGELDFLKNVQGVGDSLGVVASVRKLWDEADFPKANSVLADVAELSVADVIAAADDGDELAEWMRERLVEKLALTVIAIANLIDPAAVIFAGGAARRMTPLIPALTARLAELTTFPPEVRLSTLGRDIVLQGAVRSAITAIRQSIRLA